MKFFLALFLLIISTGSEAQIINTVAGNGVRGYNGDGITATNAQLNLPDGVATDVYGNIFIADTYNHRIRKVTPNGVITTVAGNGSGGYSGDGSSAITAQLYYPESVDVDPAGNLYIADFGNQVVRKVTASGIITTIAGNGIGGYTGDGGLATQAELSGPYDVKLDAKGNLLVADWRNNVIRKVSTNGTITTVAGNGILGYSGDGGLATAAKLNNPYGVAVDAAGNIFIGDADNDRIRKVSPNGIITTFAGNGTRGYSGDGGIATSAQVSGPIGITIDTSGNVYFADFGNNRIRKIASNGIITTVAGNGSQGFSGDGGLATAAQLYHPIRICLNSAGNFFIAERDNNRIRKITTVPTIASFSPTSAPTGATVIITGTNFNGTTAVTFGGVAAKSFVVNSTTKITAVVGIGATGSVRVTAPGGSATITGFTFCVTPTIKITASTGSIICSGTPVIFTATATNGGTTPLYKWQKNGLSVGTNSSTYKDSTLKTGDSIRCIFNSNAPCVMVNNVISNALKYTINLPHPVINITSNKNTTICSNTLVTFTAAVTPVYQWKKNGLNIGNNSNIYKDSLLKTNDYIQCFLISDVSACNSSASNIINSNPLSFKVNTPPSAPSAINGPSQAYAGQKNIYFTVTPVANVTFIWTLPTGALIDSGQGTNTVKVTWGSAGGDVSVIASNSCGSSSKSTKTVGLSSNVTSLRANNILNINQTNTLNIYPNPAGALANITFSSQQQNTYVLTISDAESKVLEIKKGKTIKGYNTIRINTAKYPKGIYYVSYMDKENGQRNQKLVIGNN